MSKVRVVIETDDWADFRRLAFSVSQKEFEDIQDPNGENYMVLEDKLEMKMVRK